MGILEREKGTEEICETTTENFPKLMSNTKPQTRKLRKKHQPG